jgi:hypothetical protein
MKSFVILGIFNFPSSFAILFFQKNPGGGHDILSLQCFRINSELKQVEGPKP